MMQLTQSRPLAVTDEEGDLLYGLVRLRKPIICLETGTGYGVSASRIGAALAVNGEGRLHTCELNADLIAEARARVAGLPVEIHQVRGAELIARHEVVDFVLVDSGTVDVRMEELRLLDDDRVAPGGVVVVHDALNVDYATMFDEFSALGWPRLVFSSLAGIAVYRRPE